MGQALRSPHLQQRALIGSRPQQLPPTPAAVRVFGYADSLHRSPARSPKRA